MKKIIMLMLMLCNVSIAFSQYEYPYKIYTGTGMNVKGRVKKIIEMQVSTDRKGRVNNREKKMKYVYDFDENGNLIKEEHIELGYSESVNFSYEYEYKNGKLNKINRKVLFSGSSTKFLSYNVSSFSLKDKDGNIEEIHYLNNGRVSEVKHFTNSQTVYRHRHLYEYSNLGRIIRKTYKDDAESYRKYSTWETYDYNKQGDLNRKENFSEEGKLEWITSFEYKYDKNKNWIKCNEMFYEPGEDKDDRNYTERTRTYEYFTGNSTRVETGNKQAYLNAVQAKLSQVGAVYPIAGSLYNGTQKVEQSIKGDMITGDIEIEKYCWPTNCSNITAFNIHEKVNFNLKDFSHISQSHYSNKTFVVSIELTDFVKGKRKFERMTKTGTNNCSWSNDWISDLYSLNYNHSKGSNTIQTLVFTNSKDWEEVAELFRKMVREYNR